MGARRVKKGARKLASAAPPKKRPPLAEQPYDYSEGTTNSLQTAWQDCRQQCRFQLDGWAAPQSTESLEFGNLFHYLLEHAYKQVIAGAIDGWKDAIAAFEDLLATYLEKYEANRGESSLGSQTMELLSAQAQGVWPAYCRHWCDDFKQKKARWLELEGVFDETWDPPKGHGPHRLRGKRDGMFERRVGYVLFETKTKGNFKPEDVKELLAFDRQIHFYKTANDATVARLGLPKRITAALYNVVRRPQIKPGKDGDLAAYAQRVEADARERPNFYFCRVELEYEPKAVSIYERELDLMLGEFARWSRGEIPTYRNRSACIGRRFNCKFIAACAKGHLRNYRRTGRLFEELED